MADINYDFHNGNYPTMKFCDLDESLNLANRPLEKLKLTNGQKVLVHILTTKNIGNVDIHYNPDLGSFTCFKGACCGVEKPAFTKYLIPIAVYTVDSNMQVISTKLEPYVLHVSSKRIPELLELAQYNGALTDMDLVVSSVGDKFPILKFTYAGAARCKKEEFAKDYKEVSEYMEQNAPNVVRTAAKNMTAEEYQAYLDKKADTSNNEGFSDVNHPSPVKLDELFGK